MKNIADDEIVIIKLPGPNKGALEEVRVWKSKLTIEQFTTFYGKGRLNSERLLSVSSVLAEKLPAFDNSQINAVIEDKVDDCKFVLEQDGSPGKEIFTNIIEPLIKLKAVFDHLKCYRGEEATEILTEIFNDIFSGAASVSQNYNKVEKLAYSQMHINSSLESSLLYRQDQIFEIIYYNWALDADTLVKSLSEIQRYISEIKNRIVAIEDAYQALNSHFSENNKHIIKAKDFVTDFNVKVFRFISGFSPDEYTPPTKEEIITAKQIIIEMKEKIASAEKNWTASVGNVLSYVRNNEDLVNKLIDEFKTCNANIAKNDRDYPHGERIPSLLIKQNLLTQEQWDKAYEILNHPNLSSFQVEHEATETFRRYSNFIFKRLDISESLKNTFDQGESYVEQIEEFLHSNDDSEVTEIQSRKAVFEDDADLTVADLHEIVKVISSVFVLKHGNHLNSGKELLLMLEIAVKLGLCTTTDLQRIQELEVELRSHSRVLSREESRIGLSAYVNTEQEGGWISFEVRNGSSSNYSPVWRVSQKITEQSAKDLLKKHNITFENIIASYQEIIKARKKLYNKNYALSKKRH